MKYLGCFHSLLRNDEASVDSVSPVLLLLRLVLRSVLRYSFITSLLSSIIFAVSAQAQPIQTGHISESRLASYRYHYDLAKDALRRKNTPLYEKHLAQLDGYPLKQYLEYSELRGRLGSLPFDDINDFLDTYESDFLATRLRGHVLTMLASRDRWDTFLHYYRPEFQSTAMQCHHTYAELKQGDPDESHRLLSKAAKLWDVGKSQPNACDDVFKHLKNSPLYTQDLIWSRFNKAMQARKRSLANYIRRDLEGSYAKLAELYQRIDRRPSDVTKKFLFNDNSLQTQHIIAHGIQRFARRQPLDALYHWEMYQAQQPFDEDIQYATTLEVFKRLSRKGHADAVHQLLSQSQDFRDQKLVEEVIRENLEKLDWERVYDGILMLSHDQQKTDRWQYWRARAQEELGKQSVDFPPAIEVYHALSENRSFYGFLSADRVNKPYSLADASMNVDLRLIEHVSAMPGMQRARELWETGSMIEARAEWVHTSKYMGAGELLAAGQLAQDWGWHSSGIQAMISGNLWDHLTMRFPIIYEEHVNRMAHRTKIAPTLIYAVARQESAFLEDARSPAGAMGLMQVMPGTARQTAREMGIRHRTRDLLNPEHNIKVGSHYLSGLLDKFDGNRILATAAYNAGPHRVLRWLSDENSERPADVWIETIPFRETRGYVQNVLSYSVIYGYRLGKSLPLITEDEAKKPL